MHDPRGINEHVPALRLNVDALHDDTVVALNEKINFIVGMRVISYGLELVLRKMIDFKFTA